MNCHYRPGRREDVWNRYRAQVCISATGRVLEIGAEDVTPYEHVRFLALIRASDAVRRQESKLTAQVPNTEIVEADLEQLPFPSDAFDVVVCTFSLCCARDHDQAMREIRRVLRPAGHLRFLEHSRGLGVIGNAQDRVAQMQSDSRCKPNLDVTRTVERAGLVMRRTELWSAAGSLLHTPLVQGVASHPDQQYEREVTWLLGGSCRGDNTREQG